MADAPQRRDEQTLGLVLVGVMVAAMWVEEAVDSIAFSLDSEGIRPRDPDGLPGILAAPFLHAGWDHLIGNTIPFLLLGAVIALGGLRQIALVTLIVIG